MGAAPVLDPAVIATLRQLNMPGEPDVLTEVLKLFLEEAPSRLAKLRNASAMRNIQEVQRIAHSLKGSAGNIGASAMFEICRELDGLGRSGSPESVDRLVDALDAEYVKVEAEIHRLTAV